MQELYKEALERVLWDLACFQHDSGNFWVNTFICPQVGAPESVVEWRCQVEWDPRNNYNDNQKQYPSIAAQELHDGWAP